MEGFKETISKIKPDGMSKQEAKLYYGVVSGEWISFEMAGKSLWPRSKNQSANLTHLKNSLLNKTISSFLELKSSNSYHSEYISCYRQYSAIFILRALGMMRAYVFLAERLLSKALKLEITDIVIPVAKLLHLHAGSVLGDQKRSKEYRENIETYLECQMAEWKAQVYLTDIMSDLIGYREVKPDLIDKAKKYETELKLIQSTVSTLQFQYLFYNIQALIAQATKDHQALKLVCETALKFFKTKPYKTPKSILFSFAFKPIQLAILNKDYPSAINSLKNALSIADKGSYNYVVCLIHQAILGFHSNDHNLSASAINESAKFKKYKPVNEQWKIIEAYATILDIKTPSTFRLNKFLNEVPLFSKDKRGNNIPILIIQILFYLRQNKRGKIIDRIEALKLYSQRYLKQDSTFRSNCFIHMLATLPKANFHPVAVQRHAKKYSDQLSKYQSDEVEIIPYEELWERVLGLLK